MFLLIIIKILITNSKVISPLRNGNWLIIQEGFQVKIHRAKFSPFEGGQGDVVRGESSELRAQGIQ